MHLYIFFCVEYFGCIWVIISELFWCPLGIWICAKVTVLSIHTLASSLQDTQVRSWEWKGAGREKARKSNNREEKYAWGRERVEKKALEKIWEASFRGREQLYCILLSDKSVEMLHKSPQPFQQIKGFLFCFVLSFSFEKHIMRLRRQCLIKEKQFSFCE